MANTPNYNLSIYPASDITTKFIAFRTDTSGTQATSNFMIIDTAMKDIQDQVTDLQNTPGLTQISATGTNTYIATMTGFGYLEGQSIILSVNNANTGSSTLNINSLGARPLMKYKADGTLAQLSSGDLRANNLYLFTNKGSNWVLVGYSNAEQINVNGTVGNMIGVSSNNTLIDSGLAQSAIEVKVNTDYTAYEAIAAKEIVGLGTDNKWHKVKSGSSFPIGTIYGVAESAVAANAIVRVIMTGATNPLWTGYTTSTLDTNTKIFIKGEITDGQFLPTNVATTVMEPDASYLAIGYYVSATVTKLDATHMIYTLNTDGNVNAIDGVALGGASGGSGSTQVFSIGNGTDTEFTLNHGANTTFVQLLVRTTATPQTYLVPDWQIVDNDNVKLLFSDAPATNEYQAVLFVFNPSTKVTKYEETIGNGTDTTFYIEHNLGVNYPTVKLIQLTDEALVFPSIQYVDSGGNPSQNTLKLGFYSAPATNSLKVVVESDIVQTEGAQLLGGLTLNEIKEMILQAENPIGKIRLSVENVNPSTHLGFGTWERWGQGRVPVGVATSGTFNTVEKTGGEETHTLGVNEIPAVGLQAQGSLYYFNGTTGGAGLNAGTYGANVSGGAQVKTLGGGEAHNNLQPYITCYMWKRTA